MNGKILKVSSNDVYGNVDDRKVSAFAAFRDNKYKNNYIIFSFLGEYSKNKLYFGSVHFKEDALVVFLIKEEPYIEYVNKFIDQYVSNNVDEKEYKILDISDINKIILVSFNDMNYGKLELLDEISIDKKSELGDMETRSKVPIFLYFILLIMVSLLFGVTYLYFYPNAFDVELKVLSCTRYDIFDDKVELYYDSNITISFDEADRIRNINNIDTYFFESEETYLDFKNNKYEEKLSKENGGFKYDDNKFQLRILYNEDIIIQNYDEIKEYFKKEGYSCTEGKYYE